ncbi:MAG: hypothetical protein HQM12_14875 [SAR324 cluster bacterium]|nr:hypothetical protein [SAR324 cluster bacterium]
MTESHPPVEATTIIPVDSNGLQDILTLAGQGTPPAETHEAWQKVEQQIHLFSLKKDILDLNAIFRDILLLQILVHPIVEDRNKPLIKEERTEFETCCQQMKGDIANLKQLVSLLKKNVPLQTESLDACLNAQMWLMNTQKTLWERFQTDWASYEQQYQLYRQAKTRGSSLDPNETGNSDIELLEPHPPVFNRNQWYAAGYARVILNAHLERQTGAPVDQAQAIMPLLVEGVRHLYFATEGFELLNKVKIIQRRNMQLVQQLQQFYTLEPIIQKKPVHSPKPQKIATPGKPKPSKPVDVKKWILGILSMLFLLILLLLFTFLLRPDTEEKILRGKGTDLALKPENDTLSFPTKVMVSDKQKQEAEELGKIILSHQSNIKVIPWNSELQELAQQSAEVSEDMVRKLQAQFGSIPFAFAQEAEAVVFWKNKFLKLSKQQLKAMLENVTEDFDRLMTLTREIGSYITGYKVALVADFVNGVPGYSLVFQDPQNNETGRISLNQGEMDLEWKNAHYRIQDARQLVDIIQQSEQ